MIHINLLPEERKKKKSTPFPLLAIVVLGVAFITGEVAAGVWLWTKKANLEDRKQSLEKRKEKLKVEVKKFERLQSEIQQLKKRRQILEQIRPNKVQERYRWSFSVDKLFSVVNNSPGVWLTSLEGTKDPGRGGRRSPGRNQAQGQLTHQLNFVARSAGNLNGLTKFEERIKRRMIEEERVFSGLDRKWRQFKKGSERSEEYVENIYWTTGFSLQHRNVPGQQQTGSGPGSAVQK